MAPHLSRSLTWEGRTIAWERLGEGPPLVFLHGTPWSSALWRPIAHALADRFSVYLWDMPGYGESSMSPEHAVDLGFQGGVFAHLLRTWGLDRPHVIAHDIGGAVALRTRTMHGARYASICLVDAVVLRPWGSPFFTLVRENADVFTRLPLAVHRGAVEAYIRGASARGLDERDAAMLTAPWSTPQGQQAFYRQIAQADERYTDDVVARLGQLTEPTHIVWGEQDTWIPVDRAARLGEMIPHASVRVIEGAGHLIQLDAPADLAADLSRWTESVREA